MAVLIFAPVFTVLAFSAAESVMKKLARSARVEVPRTAYHSLTLLNTYYWLLATD